MKKMKKKIKKMDFEHQQKLDQMNKEFGKLMRDIEMQKAQELQQRKLEIENFLKQQNLNNQIELNKIKEENLKNEMDINMNIIAQIEAMNKEIEYKHNQNVRNRQKS